MTVELHGQQSGTFSSLVIAVQVVEHGSSDDPSLGSATRDRTLNLQLQQDGPSWDVTLATGADARTKAIRRIEQR